MEPDEIVDAVGDTQSTDKIWIEAEGGVSGWFTVESARMDHVEPEKDGRRWIEGTLDRNLIVPEEIQEEMDLVYRSAYLSSRTDGGEWQAVTLQLPEEWRGDGPKDSDYDTVGELREVEDVTVVPGDMWEYREAALGEASSLRADSLRRAIYADAVVGYVADRDGVDVGEFVEELEAEDLGELIGEYGKRMFPEDFDVIEVSERTRADVLSTLRYFYDL